MPRKRPCEGSQKERRRDRVIAPVSTTKLEIPGIRCRPLVANPTGTREKEKDYEICAHPASAVTGCHLRIRSKPKVVRLDEVSRRNLGRKGLQWSDCD